MSGRPILELLPWRHPFLMIDSMIEMEPHRRIRTKKLVTGGDSVVYRNDEPCWLPSMLLLEGMSQSAALLFRLSYGDEVTSSMPMLGFLKAGLHGSARAGEAVVYDVDSIKMTRNGGLFEARATCNEALIAEAELAFSAAGEGRT